MVINREQTVVSIGVVEECAYFTLSRTITFTLMLYLLQLVTILREDNINYHYEENAPSGRMCFTPLCFAVRYGQRDVVNLCLKKGKKLFKAVRKEERMEWKNYSERTRRVEKGGLGERDEEIVLSGRQHSVPYCFAVYHEKRNLVNLCPGNIGGKGRQQILTMTALYDSLRETFLLESKGRKRHIKDNVYITSV